jgi:hypothetical protein
VAGLVDPDLEGHRRRLPSQSRDRLADRKLRLPVRPIADPLHARSKADDVYALKAVRGCDEPESGRKATRGVLSKTRQNDPAALNGVQGLLAKSYSDDVAEPPLHSFSCRRHSAKRMNTNTCTFCELMFTRVMKARNISIDATVLFVDLRGYTITFSYWLPIR